MFARPPSYTTTRPEHPPPSLNNTAILENFALDTTRSFHDQSCSKSARMISSSSCIVWKQKNAEKKVIPGFEPGAREIWT